MCILFVGEIGLLLLSVHCCITVGSSALFGPVLCMQCTAVLIWHLGLWCGLVTIASYIVHKTLLRIMHRILTFYILFSGVRSLQPLLPGEKRKKEAWENIYVFGMVGNLILAFVLLYYQPDTEWAHTGSTCTCVFVYLDSNEEFENSIRTYRKCRCEVSKRFSVWNG